MATTLKLNAQRILNRLGLYHRLKTSRLYDIYWTIANRKFISDRETEIAFYRATLHGLSKNDIIYDVGANLGYKTQIFLKLGAKVVAVEPDPTNQEVLRKSFHTLRFTNKPVTIIGKALSDKTGSEMMWITKPGSAINTLNAKWVQTLETNTNRFGQPIEFAAKRTVETITLEDLFNTHGRPYFIKIDVEGHEANVLRGMRHAVPFVSFEVNLPEFRPEGLQCIDSLEHIAPGGDFNYAPDCTRGMTLREWLPYTPFVNAFKTCNESCIEVFWRANLPPQ